MSSNQEKEFQSVCLLGGADIDKILKQIIRKIEFINFSGASYS